MDTVDPDGLWTPAEISEGAPAAAFVGTAMTSGGNLTISVMTGAVCTLRECPSRFVLESTTQRVAPADPIYLCQDFEGYEIQAQPPLLRACGVEINLASDVVRTAFAPARDFHGAWSVDRQCRSEDTVTYDARTYQSDFAMCQIEQTERTGTASWKLESYCGQEESRSIVMHDVFLEQNVMTQILIDADLIAREQKLFRC